MTPLWSTAEHPCLVLHGMDPNFPSAIIPNVGVSWFAMDKHIGDYKAQLLQSIAEAHERIQEYNSLIREQMKQEYDKKHKVDVGKHAVVGDRVYILSPNGKPTSSHPKLANEWSDPYRVLETSQNSALITRIGENVEPIRVQFHLLPIVFWMNPWTQVQKEESVVENPRRQKQPKTVCSVTLPCFSGASLLSPLEKGHLAFLCGDGCFEGATMKDIDNCKFTGAVAREPVTTIWERVLFNERTSTWEKK